MIYSIAQKSILTKSNNNNYNYSELLSKKYDQEQIN